MCIYAARGGIGTATPSLQQLNNKSSSSLEENLLRTLRRLPQTTTSEEGPEYAFNCILSGNDENLTATVEYGPLPLQMLSPILKFITSSYVLQFLFLNGRDPRWAPEDSTL